MTAGDRVAPEAAEHEERSADRAIVADTMMAAGSGKPTLPTGDVSMIQRLFERFGPKKNPKKPAELIPDYDAKLPGKVADKIAADPRWKDGFEVTIPDGLGGTKTIVIVPMR